MMKLAIFTALILNCGLYASWDPKECLGKDPSISFDVLEDKDFCDLEKRVLWNLKDSSCSDEKAKLIMELIALTRPKSCVEIGVFLGASFLPIIATLKYLGHGHAIAIDAWSNEVAVEGIPEEEVNYFTWSHFDEYYVERLFLLLVLKWASLKDVTILKMTSESAAPKVGAIDFLHLDGSFSEEGALRDVNLYLPKVKSGGYILLSNMLYSISGQPCKMKAMWKLYDECELVCEIENSNTVLFRKQ